MADELKIWALREGNEAEPVASVENVKLENTLEETLVGHPEMLEAELQLVGRQTPTAGGPLDLLGVDSDGRLVVYELKRGTLTRDAVTQCIDYASDLNAMSDEQLASHIAKRSGTSGIKTIENFEEWYQDGFGKEDLGDLLPPRLVLVGLGVDPRAERMARFLSDVGVDISVLTFFGFEREGTTLLARQVEVEYDGAPSGPRQGRLSASEKRQQLAARLSTGGLTELWSHINGELSEALPGTSREQGSWGTTHHMNAERGPRGFYRLAVADSGGLEVHWILQPHYDGRERLIEEAEQAGWQFYSNRNRYLFPINSTEEWDEQGPRVVAFLQCAQGAWDPALGETGEAEEQTP